MSRSAIRRYHLAVKQRTKDVIVIPGIIATIFMLVGIPLSAWFTKQPMRALVTVGGLRTVVSARTPAWLSFLLVGLFIAAFYVAYRQRRGIMALRREVDAIRTVGISADQIAQIKLAGVLETKAGQADVLALELEKVQLVYNKDHETLLRPLGKDTLPDVIQKERDKRLYSFRIEYYAHINSVKYHVPDFHSTITDGPRPYRNIEYLDLREKLKEHAGLLRKLAAVVK